MQDDFACATLGSLGKRVCRLGLSCSYRPGKETVHAALDAGINYFFCFGIDNQMISVLRDLPRADRDRIVIGTGAYNYVITYQNPRKALEKRLRQLRTDYIDVFHFLGVMKRKEYNARVREEFETLRSDARVRGIAMSMHDRKFAGELASAGALDALMVRYNAAHRGAEQDIFPHLATHNPGVISFTATRWTFLLRSPQGWHVDKGKPDAGMCYRFVLSNPHVDVCLTAPRSVRELRENIAAFRKGPLAEDEMRFMRDFGDAVYAKHKKFM